MIFFISGQMTCLDAVKEIEIEVLYPAQFHGFLENPLHILFGLQFPGRELVGDGEGIPGIPLHQSLPHGRLASAVSVSRVKIIHP